MTESDKNILAWSYTPQGRLLDELLDAIEEQEEE